MIRVSYDKTIYIYVGNMPIEPDVAVKVNNVA